MKNKIIELILKKPSSYKNRLIGVEIEDIVYTDNCNRIPVNPSKDYSASDLLNDLIKNKENNNETYDYSIEPGGQIEWSSTPHLSLYDIQKEYKRHLDSFRSLLFDNNLFAIDYTVEPIYSPSTVELIDSPKYILMNNLFEKTGSHGNWMMRNTASIQINMDILSKDDGEQMAFLSDCISPFASLLFANAPFIKSDPVSEKNYRHIIWSNTDKNRCGYLFDHGIISSDNLIEKFSDIVLNAPSIFSMDRNDNVKPFMGTINKWLNLSYDKNELSDQIINVALHQIFTHVRFKKGIIELRCADRPPFGYEFAPIAFWVGILTDGVIRDKLMELFLSWKHIDRELSINNADIINLENIGPQNTSMHGWINYFSELALEGLSNRSHQLSISNEEDLLIPYLELFRNKGVPGLFRQNEYINSNKNLKEFIRKPF
jgi:glutamate--cysteine ligase